MLLLALLNTKYIRSGQEKQEVFSCVRGASHGCLCESCMSGYTEDEYMSLLRASLSRTAARYEVAL